MDELLSRIEKAFYNFPATGNVELEGMKDELMGTYGPLTWEHVATNIERLSVRMKEVLERDHRRIKELIERAEKAEAKLAALEKE